MVATRTLAGAGRWALGGGAGIGMKKPGKGVVEGFDSRSVKQDKNGNKLLDYEGIA